MRICPCICANCKWWVPRDENEKKFNTEGTCHFYPPKKGCRFPETNYDAWCSKFTIIQQPRSVLSNDQVLEFGGAQTMALGA